MVFSCAVDCFLEIWHAVVGDFFDEFSRSNSVLINLLSERRKLPGGCTSIPVNETYITGNTGLFVNLQTEMQTMFTNMGKAHGQQATSKSKLYYSGYQSLKI